MKSKRRKKQDKKRLKFEKKYFKQKLRGEFEKGPNKDYLTLLEYLIRDGYIEIKKDRYILDLQYMVVVKDFIYDCKPFVKNHFVRLDENTFVGEGNYRDD